MNADIYMQLVMLSLSQAIKRKGRHQSGQS